MILKQHQFYVNCWLKINRRFHTNKIKFAKPQINYKFLNCDQSLCDLIKKHESKIIYSSFISYSMPGYKKGILLKKKEEHENRQEMIKLQSEEPIPIVLKYLVNHEMPKDSCSTLKNENRKQYMHFPFGNEKAIAISAENTEESFDDNGENFADSVHKEISRRQELLKPVNYKNWMKDYENYEESLEDEEDMNSWKVNYGTSDPNIPISSIPCGGCGALLHCQDPAIPGYIPSEIYKNSVKKAGVHLRALICQRCHFLKYYDLALQVRVSAEDYPKVLKTIKNKQGLIVLVIDLLNFPCSVWPGIADILGTHKSIVVVGNKVDLLPRDSRGYLDKIRHTFTGTVLETIGKETSKRIKHIGLISAKTGWGIEELITKLQNLRKIHGDVFIVGCTNVGKSSLFNSLLQSDYCKVQAVDLIQRATTSVWPGTTLNLLKFPILRPSGWRLYVRTKRLQQVMRLRAAEEKLNKIQLQNTGDAKYATLMGHIDRTFVPELPVANTNDPFSVHGSANSSGKVRLGINEKDPIFASSKWCYDTPGVVQPDQIIHLLTTEELILTLPRELIRPRTFTTRPAQTLFIGGIGRLDYIEGPYSIKLTVFCANSLPLTMCDTKDADLLYKQFLGTDLFQVPKGSEERMNNWPHLTSNNEVLKLTGKEKNTSCGDIVLSDAGWITITCDPENEVTFKAWTPEARGIYLRKSLLPHAANLRGKKIRSTPAYASNKFFVPQ